MMSSRDPWAFLGYLFNIRKELVAALFFFFFFQAANRRDNTRTRLRQRRICLLFHKFVSFV